MAHFVRFCAHFRSHSMPIRGEARPVSMPPHRFLDSTLAVSNSVQMGRKWEPARRGMVLWADLIPDSRSFMRLHCMTVEASISAGPPKCANALSNLRERRDEDVLRGCHLRRLTHPGSG